ncbi:helix-turn-helix transcriptional regulator [Castellaniella sp.]|uniref:helix-turn-helix transcriptional regulator n=1 Tax=Castellaniella sp. TaxID=1955812 RepID=UPI002AFEAC21|nr:helix-turn-helix transcriptional regulator [Castellaniella sp.]
MSIMGMHLGDASPSAQAVQRLTLREREVAAYITRGRSNKYIAAELGVSQRTIEAHRARIFMKVGVRNAVELTQHYVRWKLPLSDDHGSGWLPHHQIRQRAPVQRSGCVAVLGRLGR